MRLLTMLKTMAPYQANHDYALPDEPAGKLIDLGYAALSPRHADSGLQPDVPPVARPASIAQVVKKAAKPVAAYLTRGRKAKGKP